MIVRADARSLPIADGTVQCCVTSPPYYGLRNYGVADQIGIEPTGADYVAAMVAVFREVHRVLRDDGTLWLNLGDSYNAYNGGAGPGSKLSKTQTEQRPQLATGYGLNDKSLKPKDLMMIPARVALALQADGWWLRSDVVWNKPNPMPESINDRPTKSHEYVFLLAKSERYYYDKAAICEPYQTATLKRGKSIRQVAADGHKTYRFNGEPLDAESVERGRNARSVWTIATQPYRDAHFAVMPEKLVEPCILAGSRPAGKRCDCDQIIASPTGTGAVDDPSMTTGRAGMNRPRRADEGTRPVTRRQQREWAAQIRGSAHAAEMATEAGSEAFAHYIRTDASGARPPRPDLLELWLSRGWLGPTTPCDCPEQPGDLVLDPFAGSGTVGVVARRYARRFIGCDLNPAYIGLARQRLAETHPGLPMESTA